MRTVVIYSSLLLTGLLLSQFYDLTPFRHGIETCSLFCLAYIMVQVGLEFGIDKRRLKSYGVDFGVAVVAAALPWLLCTFYFRYILNLEWPDSLFIGRFAAPTSAGVLFTMLAAGGLKETWVFRKARVLAIFDDLDTIILLVPLQMMFIGFNLELIGTLVIIGILLWFGYTYMNQFIVPARPRHILLHSILTVLCLSGLIRTFHIHVEVLLPAFVVGMVMQSKLAPTLTSAHPLQHLEKYVDSSIKFFFMFLVGCSIPKITFGLIEPAQVLGHVLLITLLANLGKCFPLFCYRREVKLSQRLALSVAMFPRGEVGAGILLLAIGLNLDSIALTIGGLSLALNLLLTGLFILVVLSLTKKVDQDQST